MTRYLITGGAGFIGSNIADALLAKGLTVRIADNFSTGKRSNIAGIVDQVELLEGDLGNLDFARYAVQDVDYVLHQAAIPSVPRSLADPLGNNRAGVEATLNVLVAARDAGVKRMTFASSSSIYGDVADPELQRQPKHEELMLQPLSPYGASKAAAEQYCLVFYQAYGFETVPLRYFNVFGPRQTPTSEYSAVIPKFITALLAGKSPTIYGDGEQTRDFTYIDNIVAANLFALHTPGVAGQAYNAALGQPISLNHLMTELNTIMGNQIPAIHAEARKGDIKHSCADVRKILRAGFVPVLDFTQGLQKAVAWYRQLRKPQPDGMTQPVQIVRAIARLNIGGPAIHVVRLSAGLDPQRFRTELVAGVCGPNEGDMSDLATAAGVQPHWIPALQREIVPHRDLQAIWHFLRLLRRYRPTILHTHTFKAGFLGRIAAWLVGTPIVVHTFHGHVFHGYWNATISKGIVLLERWLAKRSTLIVTVSETLRQELLAYRIAAPEKIKVVSLGFDLQPFVACAQWRGQLHAELGLAASTPLIGCVGRLVPVKNQLLFLQAAAQLVKQGSPAHFVLVGDGELRHSLEAALPDLNLTGRVHFLGWRRDLPYIYAGLTVAVNSSLNEGTPVALIEAMAAGVPVAATAVGGVPDLIQEGQRGYLAPSGDTAALAAAIERAYHAPASVRQAAQDHVLHTYSLTRLYQQISDLYDGLLRANRA